MTRMCGLILLLAASVCMQAGKVFGSGVPRLLREVTLNKEPVLDDAAVDAEGDSGETADEEAEEFVEWVQEKVEELDLPELDHRNNEEFLNRLTTPWEIVYPVQIRSRAEVATLDTHDIKSKNQKDHYSGTSFQFVLGGKRLKLRLELNKYLLAQGLKQKRNVAETTQIIEDSSLESCYYQGYVRKSANSQVAVSTCDGISGMMRLKNETYIIRPLKPVPEGNQTRHPHVVYKALTAESLTCDNENGMWQPYRELHIGEFLRKMKIAKAKAEDWDLLSEIKYAEVALVADNALFRRFNSSLERTVKYLAEVANIADAYLRSKAIHLNLVFVEVWDLRDMMTVSVRPRQTLTNFLDYRQETMGIVGLDTAHLISGLVFEENSLGMAVPDSVCTDRAVGITRDPDSLDPSQVASGLLHMIDHTLGLQHENEAKEETEGACQCEDWYGCIMSQKPLGKWPEHPNRLASCSSREMHLALMGGLGTCLLNKPYEESYEQTCGNGIVERGEECDCKSEEECRYKDPCCDPSTCLLKSWATCRYGDCCYNCTVLPSYFLCRAPETECDVPEYCDGISGHCPANALFQDGESCRGGESFCYRGACHTYADQCQSIWGTGSMPGDDKCFETFNPAGRFNGHCGLNFTSDEYIKCEEDHVKCGLLHCAGGDKSPHYNNERTFSRTNVVLEGNEYECKSLNGYTSSLSLPQVGMVEDGTKCDRRSMCIASKCVPLSEIVSASCPKGLNNLTCSGRGVCTSEVKCFCHLDYTGDDCSITKNKTTTPLATTPSPLLGSFNTTPYENLNITLIPLLSGKTTEVESVPMPAERSVSIQWLIIVLAGGAGGALLILICCFLCYRRKSPGAKRKKKKFGSMVSFSSTNSKKTDEINQELAANRLISFGNMPSYRADKIKKLMRKSMTGQSGTGSESEHSHKDRDSTEVKMSHTLPSRPPPEKGILKKYPRSADDLERSSLSEYEPLRHKRVPSSPRMGTKSRAPYRYPLPEIPRTADAESREMDCMLPKDDPIGFIDEDDMKGDGASDENLSCSECSDGEGSVHGQGAAKQSSPSRGSEDSIENTKNKIMKLKNINDLLKQIDEQFNSVLKQTTEDEDGAPSPAHSGCSETEADRQFPRDSYYKQSDIENGYSPPHRSPVLSPNQSQRGSSGDQVSSPDALPPYSPIQLSPEGSSAPQRVMSPSRCPSSPPSVPHGGARRKSSSKSPRGSPTQPDPSASPVVSAVPYRGIKTVSSPPTRHSPQDLKNPGSPAPLSSSPSPKSPKGIFGRNSPKSRTHALLDGYPFKKRGSPPNDGFSNSEGYHSDKVECDDPIIIREIPLSKPAELRFTPDPSGAYTKAPGSPGSPEDIDV